MFRISPSMLQYLLMICALWTAAATATVDIALSVAANPTVVVVNRTAFVSAEVFNLGDETATDVIVTVILPPEITLVQASTTLGQCSGNPIVVCLLGDLPSGTFGKQATISVEVTLNETGSINHSFSLTTSAAETSLNNNDRTATIEVVPVDESADLGVSYGLMPNFAYQGGLFSVPLSIMNYGPQPAGDAVVEFRAIELTLADLDSATPSQGICSTDLTNCSGLACLFALQTMLLVRCELGPLSSGEQASIDVNIHAALAVSEVMQLSVNAHDQNRADPDLNSNSSSQQVETISAPDIEAPSGGPSACFIATAAYGSSMHEDVILLRQFRDNHLIRSAPGRKLVEYYYRYSPFLAEAIHAEPEYRAITRILLKPVILFIRYPALAAVFALMTIIMILQKYHPNHRSDSGKYLNNFLRAANSRKNIPFEDSTRKTTSIK